MRAATLSNGHDRVPLGALTALDRATKLADRALLGDVLAEPVRGLDVPAEKPTQHLPMLQNRGEVQKQLGLRGGPTWGYTFFM